MAATPTCLKYGCLVVVVVVVVVVEEVEVEVVVAVGLLTCPQVVVEGGRSVLHRRACEAAEVGGVEPR